LASVAIQGDSAGTLLRQARERVGLHIAALAVSIRVPVKKLEALEADRLDLLPDAAFSRALASSVCRALKIDPAPVLERLPQTPSPRLWTDDAGMNVPFRGPGDMAHEPFWRQFPKPVIAGVLLLLLGALVLVFLPDDEEEQTAVKLVSSDVVQAAPAPVPVPAPELVAPPVAAAPAAPASVAPSVVVPPPVAVTPPTVVPAPAAAPLVAAKPAAPSEVVKPAVTSTGVLTLRTKAPSWVEVTDAQGVAQLRRIVTPGENVGVSGVLPLAVIVGRADATEVWIRGKAFALEGLTRENVARFEVK
jgi:cytoskeleton protein RodZ